MTTAYMQRLIAGETPTDEELAEYLAVFHRDVPSATPHVFNELHDEHGATSYELLARAALASVSARPSVILDVGCGDGALVPSIRGVDAGARIWGIDLSAHEIERARAQFGDAGTTFVHGRAQMLPFEDGAFDAATSHLALMLMQPSVPVFQEVARVLRPGGTFAYVIGTLRATGGGFDELLGVAQRFVGLSFPDFRFRATGDTRLDDDDGTRALLAEAGSYQDGVETRNVTVSAELDAAGVVGFFVRAYVFGSLPQEQRVALDAELRSRVSAVGGKIRIEMPLRLIRVRTTIR